MQGHQPKVLLKPDQVLPPHCCLPAFCQAATAEVGGIQYDSSALLSKAKYTNIDEKALNT